MSLPHRSPLLVIRVSSRGHFSVTKLLPKLLPNLLQLGLWIMYVLDITQTRKAKPEMNTTQFTVKTTRPGWADLFLNGEKVGFLMSYNTGYGYWKATVWNNELRQILVDGGARNFDANTRKALLERLNNAIEMVLV